MSQVGQVVGILRKLNDEYQTSTPKKLKLIDAYLVYVLLTGIVQFAYCLLVGTFPFNSFLSGFISTVGCFILAGKFFF
jgi:oligosaccharyltransferase complex subunit epsilon